MQRTTRRDFMALSTAAVAGVSMGAGAANERIGLALIGCGNRGDALLGECVELRERYPVEVVALCDVWKKNLEAMAGKVEQILGSRPKTFTRYGDVLALPEVDAVIIATSDFAHSPILIDAAKAGKHAYVEKPMAVRLEDANAAVDAVEAAGTIVQVGTQFRSDGRQHGGKQLLQSGAIGKLVKCQASYTRNTPSWVRGYEEVRKEDVDWEQFLMYLPKREFDPRRFRCWQLYQEYTVGLIGLLGVHPIDMVHYYTDDPLPLSAVGMGAKLTWMDREQDDMQECVFSYPKGHLMQFTGRLNNSNGGPQNVFFGTKGTYDTVSWTATGEGGAADKLAEALKSEAPEAEGHMENWLHSIVAKNRKTAAPVEAGYAHSVVAIMGALACKTGKRYLYDVSTRTIKEG